MGRQKTGKEFEALVAWIKACLRGKATVTPNDKIVDVNSGKKRQIDVSIRVRDGADETLTIVEVRDHGRPVSTPYVESVITKRDSVGADVAMIVSRSGFYRPARRTAEANRVRLFTFSEALSDDWAWIRTQGFLVVQRVLDAMQLEFFVGTPPEAHEWTASDLEELRQGKPLVLRDASGRGVASVGELRDAVWSQVGTILCEGVPADGVAREKRLGLEEFRIPSMWVLSRSGELLKVTGLGIRVAVRRIAAETTLRTADYQKVGVDSPLAQLASGSMDVGNGPVAFDLLAETDGRALGPGSRVHLRLSTVRDDEAK